MKTILILEDNDERIAAFQRNAAELGQGIDVKVWREATSMINVREIFSHSASAMQAEMVFVGCVVESVAAVDVAGKIVESKP